MQDRYAGGIGDFGRKMKTMTFSEYRASFKSEEEFREAFDRLSYDQAHALASTAEGSAMIKACIMTGWKGGCVKDDDQSD